ncbi:UbiA prenyltransferase family protein [Flavobacteriaceae bacterium]|nr:UbiA prenyltransferase family protein [Flavobacteriaceae bacterium]
MFKTLLKLLRVKDWVKNLFILLPLFFSGDLFDLVKLNQTIFVVISFCLVTSFVYILNDIFDIEFDKNHLEKKLRPIPSGKVSVRTSLFIGILFLLIGLTLLWYSSIESFYLTVFYVLLNIFYSYKLKQIPIIDFIIVSIGFVIRVLIGGEIGEIELTQWMIVMVFLLSLFIAVTKRRDDVYQYESENIINRKVIVKYTVEYMDKLITIISSTLLVSYLLFITSESVISRYPSRYLIISFLFVLIGVFRYNQITYVENKSGSPIKIFFKDLFLQITLFLWALTFFIIIYSSKL